MKILITEEQANIILESRPTMTELKGIVSRLHGLPKELKEFAIEHLKQYSSAGKGRVSGLKLPRDFSGSLSSRNLPRGFDMGVDKKGYFIHTHRGRSKSYEDYNKIPIKSIRFVDSTG